MSGIKVLATTSWNTTRLYQAEGQPITAALLKIGVYDAAIYFKDRARGIEGMIPVMNVQPFVEDERLERPVYSLYEIKEYAQRMYDWGQYSYAVRVQNGEVTVRQAEMAIKAWQGEGEQR